MDTNSRKALKDAYKEKPLIGGIYCIRCSGNDRMWLKSTNNLAGQQNKFKFAISVNASPEPSMNAEWAQYGAQSFSFAILEQLQKKETQTESEYAEDIGVLLALWTEKHSQDSQ